MPTVDLVVAIIVGFVVVGVLLVILGRLGWVELRGPFGFMARREVRSSWDPLVPVRAARLDLEQYNEVATALAVLVNARPTEIERVARDWFSMLATRLASRLKEERDHHYRVAIWLDDPTYPEDFVSIGHGMFDRNDADMDRLSRTGTIGGLAFKSANMTYYCRDRRTDPNFKPRHSIPPSLESVFGLALGKPNDRWGVVTVDARAISGFPDDSQWLVRRFGELASLGAVVWAEKATPPPVPPSGTAATT